VFISATAGSCSGRQKKRNAAEAIDAAARVMSYLCPIGYGIVNWVTTDDAYVNIADTTRFDRINSKTLSFQISDQIHRHPSWARRKFSPRDESKRRRYVTRRSCRVTSAVWNWLLVVTTNSSVVVGTCPGCVESWDSRRFAQIQRVFLAGGGGRGDVGRTRQQTCMHRTLSLCSIHRVR